MAKKKPNKKTLEENLKDPVYVNYNLLKLLEEIKRINYAILEIMNAVYQRILAEESQAKKEEREGTFKNR